jgi:hypothetical protein
VILVLDEERQAKHPAERDGFVERGPREMLLEETSGGKDIVERWLLDFPRDPWIRPHNFLG